MIKSVPDVSRLAASALSQSSWQPSQSVETRTHSPVWGACPFSPFSLCFPLLGWRCTSPDKLIREIPHFHKGRLRGI